MSKINLSEYTRRATSTFDKMQFGTRFVVAEVRSRLAPQGRASSSSDYIAIIEDRNPPTILKKFFVISYSALLNAYASSAGGSDKLYILSTLETTQFVSRSASASGGWVSFTREVPVPAQPVTSYELPAMPVAKTGLTIKHAFELANVLEKVSKESGVGIEAILREIVEAYRLKDSK